MGSLSGIPPPPVRRWCFSGNWGPLGAVGTIPIASFSAARPGSVEVAARWRVLSLLRQRQSMFGDAGSQPKEEPLELGRQQKAGVSGGGRSPVWERDAEVRSPEEAYPWSHPGGLSRQGPILPGEGEARPDLHSRAESAPGPWKLCLSRWEGRRGSSGPSNSEGAGKVSLLKKVPALKDGDFTLAECTAILLYLSRKYNTPDHWYPSDIKKRAQVDEYLSWHHANIRANAPKTMWIKVLIPLFTGQPLPSEKLQEVMEGLSTSLKQFEERFLQDKAFIIGSEISLADLVAIVELMQPVGVGCDIFEDRPRLMEWRRRVEDAVGKELFFQAHEMILNIKELSNIQIDPQLKEHLAPVLMKMLK
ncbi:PREDICTED: glutathione S-transferase theta-1-like [Charadrius vociferus]|nr:PREDICTED: glutathione S-transferase theta-1-like [Charadrius vociferus]